MVKHRGTKIKRPLAQPSLTTADVNLFNPLGRNVKFDGRDCRHIHQPHHVAIGFFWTPMEGKQKQISKISLNHGDPNNFLIVAIVKKRVNPLYQR